MLTRTLLVCAVVAGVTAILSSTVLSQPPGGPPRPGGQREGRQPPPPPNPLVEALDTDGDGIISAEELRVAADSLRKLDLNKDGRLTRDELLPRGGPGGRFGPPPGGPGGRGGPPPFNPGERPERPEAASDPAQGAIQWFATWKSGLEVARNTGRPILLVSAAPHCAGVSGMW